MASKVCKIKDTMHVAGKNYPLHIYYESRKNCTVSIRATGVHIRVSNLLSEPEQTKAIYRFRTWAENKLIDERISSRIPPIRYYQHGQQLQVGGKCFILDISHKESKSSSARLQGDCIILIVSANLTLEAQQQHISRLLSRVIGAYRLPQLRATLKRLNDIHFNKSIKGIFFKNNKSNWGSCSSRGNINISTRLLFAPNEVLEYVCIHELAHLIEANHSERFWRLVSQAMPNYRQQELWLRNHAHKCFW